MHGWTQFAEQVIDMLSEYDKQHKTSYAYYLTRKGAKPGENGVKALADAMMQADRKNQWEPIPQGVKTND